MVVVCGVLVVGWWLGACWLLVGWSAVCCVMGVGWLLGCPWLAGWLGGVEFENKTAFN